MYKPTPASPIFGSSKYYSRKFLKYLKIKPIKNNLKKCMRDFLCNQKINRLYIANTRKNLSSHNKKYTILYSDPLSASIRSRVINY